MTYVQDQVSPALHNTHTNSQPSSSLSQNSSIPSKLTISTTHPVSNLQLPVSYIQGITHFCAGVHSAAVLTTTANKLAAKLHLSTVKPVSYLLFQ